jgi:hypothetical protein
LLISAQNYENSAETQNISPKILLVPEKVLPLQAILKKSPAKMGCTSA